MGFLRPFFAGVNARSVRQIAVAESGFDEAPARLHGLMAQLGGIGTHIGNQAGFVEMLRQHHSLFDTKTETKAGRLLQRRGDKGWIGILLGGRLLEIRDDVFGFLQLNQGCIGLLLVFGQKSLALVFANLRPERRLGLEQRKYLPIFLRHKGANFALSLNNEPYSHGLHSSGGQAACHLFPQKRREHITNDAIKKSSGLLGIDPIHVQLSRRGKSLLNGRFGDFAENDPFVALFLTADGFPQMPGNGLAFTIEVSGQIDGIDFGSQGFELLQHLHLSRQDLIARPPAVLGIDSHAAHQLFVFVKLGPARFLLRGCRSFFLAR